MNIKIEKGAYLAYKASGALEIYRSDLINRAVRDRYPTAGYELAILRKVLANPTDDKTIAEFNEYNAYVERCKNAVNIAFLEYEDSV